MWQLSPGADVVQSRRGCGPVPAQMWAGPWAAQTVRVQCRLRHLREAEQVAARFPRPNLPRRASIGGVRVSSRMHVRACVRAGGRTGVLRCCVRVRACVCVCVCVHRPRREVAGEHAVGLLHRRNAPRCARLPRETYQSKAAMCARACWSVLSHVRRGAGVRVRACGLQRLVRV